MFSLDIWDTACVHRDDAWEGKTSVVGVCDSR